MQIIFIMYNNFNEEVLQNFWGVSTKCLNKIMEPDEDDELSVKSYSPYKIMEEMPEYLNSEKTDFSIMTLNCQSLNAKFDKIKVLLRYFKDNGLVIKCICLQETWIKSNHNNIQPDLSAFHLPGYQEPISQAA